MTKTHHRWQFGDFQTPAELADSVVKTVAEKHKFYPQLIVEPTCGKGAFIKACANYYKSSKILGFDINENYVTEAREIIANFPSQDIKIECGNFFSIDWDKVLSDKEKLTLILGNPPWVTISDLGKINGKNFPHKNNFQNARGIDAVTGKGNFDISESMLRQYINWIKNGKSIIAVLCKKSVARKSFKYAYEQKDFNVEGHIYSIDAKKYFDASVDACLFILTPSAKKTDCYIYSDLLSNRKNSAIGIRNNIWVSNFHYYNRWKHLMAKKHDYVWRSGVKHDCSKVFELIKNKSFYTNGYNKVYDLEASCIYPLMKSSDIKHDSTASPRKFILITQKTTSDNTNVISTIAPKAWEYLQKHDKELTKRSSIVYKGKPRYSMFGIGDYTFKNWKVAISGFYKKPIFKLVGCHMGKPIVFDDTVYFLSFDTYREANFVQNLLSSRPATEFLTSMIFSEGKRPVTASILKKIDLYLVAKELKKLEDYIKIFDHARSQKEKQISLHYD